MVQVGIDEDTGILATYYDFTEWAPLPRRQVARVLRQLADQLEVTAAELEGLEQS
jgi:acyl-CoA reductase-like NAD-dependent aldehyde dehydrogenase